LNSFVFGTHAMFLEKTTTLNPVCGKIICLEKLPTDALIVSTLQAWQISSFICTDSRDLRRCWTISRACHSPQTLTLSTHSVPQW